MGVAEGVDDRALAVGGDEGAEVPYGSAKVAVVCLPAELPGGQRAQNPCATKRSRESVASLPSSGPRGAPRLRRRRRRRSWESG